MWNLKDIFNFKKGTNGLPPDMQQPMPQDPYPMPEDPYPEAELPPMPPVQEDPIPEDELVPQDPIPEPQYPTSIQEPIPEAELPPIQEPIPEVPPVTVNPGQPTNPIPNQPDPNMQPINININSGMGQPAAAVKKAKVVNDTMKQLPNARTQYKRDYVHKRIAALEVLKHLRTAKMCNIAGIVLSFAVLFGAILARTIGMVLVLIACCFFGFFLMKVIKETQRLEYIYRLNPQIKRK